MGLEQKSVSIPKHVMARPVGDELVILNLNSEEYFGLDEVGATMWMALENYPQIQDALASLSDIYDVETQQLAQDLDELLSKLTAEGLIEVYDS